MLDSFGRIDTSAVAAAWARYREAEAALTAAREEIETAARDREWLEHAVAELTKLAPEPGEEEALADRRRTMQRSEKIAASWVRSTSICKDPTARWRACARLLACWSGSAKTTPPSPKRSPRSTGR